jgi:predicted DNA-binding protein (MmcQ/YjbR family)
MNLEVIRKYCLSLPFVTEGIQWEDDLLFRVGGKMFVVCNLDGSSISFKCSPEDFEELILIEGIIPAPYLARHHWVSVRKENALRTAELQRLMKASYSLVYEKLPKKIRNSLPPMRKNYDKK